MIKKKFKKSDSGNHFKVLKYYLFLTLTITNPLIPCQ